MLSRTAKNKTKKVISELPFASVSKRVLVQSLHMEITFVHMLTNQPLHFNKTNSYTKYFAGGLA